MLHARRRLVLPAVAAAIALTALVLAGQVVAAGKPTGEAAYADGNTYTMITPHFITSPNPHEYAQAEELYLATYPVGSGFSGSLTLPNGEHPNCNPCDHGLGSDWLYHDHVLAGAPGLGRNGTAGEMKAPWKLVLVKYKESVLSDPNFHPLKSAAAIDAGEASGMFQMINPGGANPYELEPGIIVICPVVSANA
ncbi:MAG: hypothetical protein ACXVRJ_05085 [Gaiellaceae bacterium]